jgi:3-dehydroquinate synthase
MEQRVIFSRQLNTELTTALSECEHDKVFVLTDETTKEKCWPIISKFYSIRSAQVITIGSTDTHKNLQSLTHVWEELEAGGATRHSCLINLGGGMVTDLGGFAASTFKRGIDFINIPTTLLAMVDASVGGKTGINFGGLKNEIGVFNNAQFVILDTEFLRTLDSQNLRSGYAEMLKHGLLANEKDWAELVSFDLEKPDFKHLQRMLAKSVKVKERVVKADPKEKGLRKSLNLGHTIGHALESFSLENAGKREGFPLLHGYAVAFGLVCELYLSATKMKFPTDKMHETVQFILENYGRLAITCDDYPRLIELMHHDKKNTGPSINFTLLGGIGDIHINQTASDEEIKEALDFLREG